MDSLHSILVANDSKASESDSLSSSYLGQNRSIVRRIGTTLPLGCADRPTFELLPNGSHVVRDSGKKNSLFSLADIIQLDEMPESASKVTIRSSASVPNFNCTISEIPVTSSASTVSLATSSASQDHNMVTKITALEDELAVLRSQIAMLVTNQQNQTANASSFDVSISSNLEPPYCTSTPIKSSENMHPPSAIPPPPPLPGRIPPPPPPPPPPPMAPQKEVMSIQEVIRQRKMLKSQSTNDMTVKRTKPQSVVPDMADILKDLHKVKLKSVSRSPGGTHFNKKKNDPEIIACDPASLIAAALKKKFAHRKNFESPRDDQDMSGSSFDLNHITPKKNAMESTDQTPKFGQHLLKKRNNVPAPVVKAKPEVPSFLRKKTNLENVRPVS